LPERILIVRQAGELSIEGACANTADSGSLPHRTARALEAALTEADFALTEIRDPTEFDLQSAEADGLVVIVWVTSNQAVRWLDQLASRAPRLPAVLVSSALDVAIPAQCHCELLPEDVSGRGLVDAVRRAVRLRGVLRDNTQLQETNRSQREELARLVAVRTAQVRDTRLALEVTERRLKGLAANVPGVLMQFALEPGGAPEFLYVSERSQEMLGVAPAEATALPAGPLALFHPDDRAEFFRRLDLTSAAGGDSVSWQGRFIRAGSQARWFEITARRQNDASGLWAALLVDITDRKDLQAQILKSDRLATLGILAAGVAHEINNPLTYTLNNLQVAHDRAPPGSPEAEILAEALDGAQRVREIATNLKTFSRPETDSAEAIDLVVALESSIRIAVNAVKFSAHIARDFRPLPLVVANSSRIGQVFLNLLINAAQSFENADSAQNEIQVRTYVDSLGDACVEIADNGPGIPDAYLPRIFDPFFSTKQQRDGTGLGLYICRDIVAGYQGSLTAESRVGRGATFRVRLPAAADMAGRRSERVAVPTAQGVSLRILVVDDEPMIGRSIQRLLSQHKVVLAANGQTALSMLRESEFDVVLCDLMMPELDGVGLYRALESLDHPIRDRIVFMTGGAFTERARGFLNSVTNLKLDKPLDLATLSTVLAPFAHRAAG
jgi:signal transduction histidine kinase